MEKFVIVLFSLCALNALSQNEKSLNEISYAQFIGNILNTKEEIYTLNDVVVRFNPLTDDTFKAYFKNENSIFGKQKKVIFIDKKIVLNNVHFPYEFTERDSLNNEIYMSDSGVLNNIVFEKHVEVNNCFTLKILNCTFNSGFTYKARSVYEKKEKQIKFNNGGLDFRNNKVNKKFYVNLSPDTKDTPFQFFCSNNSITLPNNNNGLYFNLILKNVVYQEFRNNTLTGGSRIFFRLDQGAWVNFHNNTFNQNTPEITISNVSDLKKVDFENNTFNNYFFFKIDKLEPTYSIDWQQFERSYIDEGGYSNFFREYEKELELRSDTATYWSNHNTQKFYRDTAMFQIKSAYHLELAARGKFYNHYKNLFNRANANDVYVDLKNIETKRLSVEHTSNPSFNTFFTLKINQFLKVFSDYGTRPSKSIIFSIYIICVFALIYFIFPNSWSQNSKHSIVRRFNFFSKYFRSSDGMNKIYLESKNNELSRYIDFKEQIESSSLELPPFFVKWARPIYKIGLFQSKIQCYIFEKTNLLQGTWLDTPKKERKFKALLTGSYLIIFLVYDLIIRLLDALALSVNTFTTLGFGEIPIKGVPRYLAILQGFIGWFMLTIFSVSLISQILN